MRPTINCARRDSMQLKGGETGRNNITERFERSRLEVAYLNESPINNFTHSTIKDERKRDGARVRNREDVPGEWGEN